MSALAELMVVDRTPLLRAVQPLRRDGLIADVPTAPASRRRMICLTAVGERQFALGMPHWKTAQAGYEELVGAERASVLRNSLNDISRT
jgi:DNA-binding MarR family transcriptional regulator